MTFRNKKKDAFQTECVFLSIWPQSSLTMLLSVMKLPTL